jgi:hypothetical protein
LKAQTLKLKLESMGFETCVEVLLKLESVNFLNLRLESTNFETCR